MCCPQGDTKEHTGIYEMQKKQGEPRTVEKGNTASAGERKLISLPK
jgi:hypothetical protein